MTDTLRPTEDEAPDLIDGPGVALPGLPGVHAIAPGERARSTPWGLIIGLVLSTLLVAGFVGGFILISASGASAVGGCGGG